MSTTPSASKHWRRTIEANVCWLTLDKAGAAVNTLSSEVLEELGVELDALQSLRLRGVVFESGKRKGFILGADVKEFASLQDQNQATAMAARGQSLLDRIAALEVPTVAAIDGFALGGGLELALACDYRIAVDSHERTLGLPEVQLGIHPGFGGSVRTVAILGPPLALDLMLTGRSLSPHEAAKCGLVDRVVAPEALRSTAQELIARRPRPRRAPLYLRLLNLAPLRRLVAARVRADVRKRARPEHYPAPYAIVELWERYGAHGKEALRAEAASIGKLLVTRTCRNLVHVFELRERLRNLAPKDSRIQHVHVVGAGTMGGDIAAWCALKGLDVTLQDRA
jgi:3-hydroxyacyl-CoA dehydrogenase/enoyl-CoA hydratase/3-hydroxybutyryl-CoA epimerase